MQAKMHGQGFFKRMSMRGSRAYNPDGTPRSVGSLAEAFSPFGGRFLKVKRGRETIKRLRTGGAWVRNVRLRTGGAWFRRFHWRNILAKFKQLCLHLYDKAHEMLDHVEEWSEMFGDFLNRLYIRLYESRIGRIVRYLWGLVLLVSLGSWCDILVSLLMLGACLVTAFRALNLPALPKYQTDPIDTPEGYLSNWRPVIDAFTDQGNYLATLAALLGVMSGYWALRCINAASGHSGVGIFPRTLVLSAVIWVEMLPCAVAIVGLCTWGNGWRDGWVAYEWEPSLWRLLRLSPGTPGSSFNTELTVVKPEAYEDTKVKLASRFYEGLLGPREWTTSDVRARQLPPAEPSLRETHVLSTFRPDLLLDLAAMVISALLVTFLLATINNTFNRVRFNDCDFQERTRPTFLRTLKLALYTEVSFVQISFRIRRCCPKPTRREALARLMHSRLAGAVTEVNRRVRGPIEGARLGRLGDKKAEALHKACSNTRELEEALEVFLDEPGGMSAQKYAEFIELAAGPLELGEHALEDGLLAGVCESYRPPPGFRVGGELRPVTLSSQRQSHQLRKVRTDQYGLTAMCEEMAAMYTQLEVMQHQVTDEINMHLDEEKRLKDLAKFETRQYDEMVQKANQKKADSLAALKDL